MRAALPVLLSLGLMAGACSEADAPAVAPTARHVVLVTVDTLRPDRLGAYGYARATTPGFDALAAESLRFERAYAHSSMTLPSIASLLTGRLPAEHGIYSNRGALKRDTTTIALRAKQAGFETAAFIGSFALRPSRRLSRGFDHYTRLFLEHEQVREEQKENRADFLTDRAIAWLAKRPPEARLLLWIHYQEPHGPYVPERFPPAAEGGKVLPESDSHSGRGAIPRYQWLGHGRLAEYQARYDGEITEMDRQLGRLVDALREGGRLDETALVLTSDHGEAFGEDDLYCAHGEGLGEALLRVPLLLRAPGLAPGVRSDLVRQIDVAPTLLSLAGLPAEELPGRSLLDRDAERPLVAQLVLRDQRWRSIRSGGYELIDDAGAARPPRPIDDATAASAPDTLAAQLERLAPWPLRLSDLVSAEDAEALRAMGYAD